MATLSSQIAKLSPEQLARLAYELKASKQQQNRRRDPCPLSFAQQRLWFIAQLEPDNPTYNCLDALRMTGQLNIPLLQQTFKEVIRRHEALRTTFDLIDGEPMQIVSSEIKLDCSVIELESLPESEQEIARLSAAESQRPFDLKRGPLLRVVVLRVSEQEHVIVFSTHHIISDGWSRNVLVREIIEIYLAFAAGRPSPLAELPTQYADFAIWQRKRLTGPVLEKHLDYWQQQLADAPHVLALPMDHPRPAVPTRRGAYEILTLSSDLSHAVRALSGRKGVTLFMTMLAAFDVLLSRYSGQTNFLIGTDIANRNHGTTEGLIGFLVNQLVLRVDLGGDPTFAELLERVKKVTVSGYTHQEAPFEKVVERLNPERHLSQAPLFQVKLVLENAPANRLELPELSIGGVESQGRIAKFDLTLAIYDGEFVDIMMEYATDLFEASTIRRMLTQFERLLDSAVRDPEQRISQLEMLSGAERQQLLVEYNDTQVPFPHTRHIHELFEEQVALVPEAMALTFAGQHLSYAELNTRANRLAHYLRQLGVKTETPVGVCLHRSIDLVVALIATLKAGGVYVPLDPEYPAERLAFILEDLAPPIILTDSTLIDELPSTWAQTICLDTDSDLWSELPVIDLSLSISSDSLAYVMYTSGSTGKPKGVAVPHRAVVRLVKQSAYVDFGPSEVFLQLAPVTFDASTLEIWGALLNGGRLVLMPPGAPGLADLGAVLKSEGVTVLWLTAGLFHLMVDQELAALACVKQVVAGGDVLSSEHVRRLLRAKQGNGVVVNGYGPTETTTFACCHRMSSVTGLDQGVPIGSPIGNTTVYVLGEKLELVGPGMVGELYIGGDGLARGYYNRPGLTAERFVPHPFSSGERLYRTGDHVRWRADGTLEFIGRVDSQVKIRGFRVEPGEVEAVLGRHGSVEDCAVVTRREENGEKRLVAYVVNDDGLSTSELREYLRARLPEFMIPAAIVVIDALPLTPNGKVDRRELAAREVHVASNEQSYVPPRTITEELICGVWAEVLRAEQVGIHDNFFDLGGDSILTIQVIVKSRALGIELSVQQIFQYQTVYELAQQLEGASESYALVPETEPFSLLSEEDRLRLPTGVVDAYPLTSLQTGMLFHSELTPGAGHYHLIYSFHLRLPFDEEALRATLHQLIALHPVLRTSFNLSDFSESLQLVHEQISLPLQIRDLRALSEVEQDESVAQWLANEKQQGFDWANGPLLRFQIDRRSEDSFQFSFSFHHAILDGWSMATMLTELFTIYSSASQGNDISATPPKAWFREFVAVERATLNSEEAQQYWTTLLSDSTQTRLPRLEPSAGPSRVAAHVVTISQELSSELKQLARTAGVPLKSVLLAAHLRALNVLSGSNDVLTGVVSQGRPETTDSERVLGLFLNTLPFRRRLNGGTWLQLVQETFAAERELLPFQRYPLARMQQDLGNDAPLFEVIFTYVHFPVYEELQHVSGLEVLGSQGVADTSFTLSVDFTLGRMGSQLGLELLYDAAELSADQIEAVGRNYLTILESMTRRPLERYEHQSLLSNDERHQMLVQWNDTRVAFDHEKCIHQLFEAQVAHTPNSLAVVSGTEQLTYEELNQRANQLAHYLQSVGVGPEVLVGVLLERSLDTIVALLAILKAGGAYVPLDENYPRARLEYMLKDAGVSVVLTEERLRQPATEIANTSTVLSIEDTWPTTSGNVSVPVHRDNLAYVMYTSGSTGQPKGVMIAHRNVTNLFRSMDDYFPDAERSTWLAVTSICFDVSVVELLWTLTRGAQVVIQKDQRQVLPDSTVESLATQLSKHQVTHLQCTPSLARTLLLEATTRDALGSLQYLALAGEALTSELTSELQAATPARLYNLYGPTEATVYATGHTGSTGPNTMPIGKPVANTQIYLLDPHFEPVPVGVAGEMYIGGAGAGRGYRHRPDLTADRFVPDMFGTERGGRLYRTGDLGRYLPDGSIEFLGRIDHQVKLRGFRIELGEIEAALRRHPQVREAVVVLREDKLVAYVVTEAQATELRGFLKELVPDYMVPSFFVELDEMPLLPNGKIDRRALPAPQSSFAEESEYEAPRTQTEELLSGLWASVLRVNRVGINDDFFELGGHSLLAIQLISRIRDTFGLEVPLSELFDHSTIATLAQSIEHQMRINDGLLVPPLLPATRTEALPLSFAQQRLWFLNQLMPESNAYTLAQAIRLKGALNLASLEQSINEVVRRHESVRTTFATVGGDPVQVIAPFEYVSLPLLDLSRLSQQVGESEALRIAAAEANRPFDLQRGPVLRAVLLRMDHDDYVLLFTMHHIASDGWSMGLLVNEVTSSYEAFNHGGPSPLSDLEIQYADFALWQRQWLAGDVLARQLDYWTSKLQGAPSLLALPTDHARPKVENTEGAVFTQLLSAELTSELKSLAQQAKATLFMTMLAAFHALLHRYAQQATILTGTPVANRTRGETEQLIGFFVNTLVLRSDFADDPTFLTHLSRLRQHALAAYAHQDLPFELLVDKLQLPRDLSYNPLFQVMFDWQEAVKTGSQLPDLEVSPLVVEKPTSLFDLSLTVGETAGGQLACAAEYNTALFEEATIERLMGHFENLLAAITRNPEQRIHELPLTSASETRALLQGWGVSDTHANKLVHQLVEEQAERTPDAIAVADNERSFTYAELNQRANQLARYLRRNDAGPEILIAVHLEPSFELVVALLAILKAGAAFTLRQPSHPMTASLVLTRESPPVELGAKVISLDTSAAEIADESVYDLSVTASGENVAYVSGSTGVLITHEALTKPSSDLVLEAIFPKLLCGAAVVFNALSASSRQS